jgi:hypothetical protein
MGAHGAILAKLREGYPVTLFFERHSENYLFSLAYMEMRSTTRRKSLQTDGLLAKYCDIRT